MGLRTHRPDQCRHHEHASRQAPHPGRVLHTLVAAIGAHVTEDPQTCRVLMEARTLATYQSAIAAAVQDSDTQAREQLASFIQAGITIGEWPGGTDPVLQARLITATLHGMMAQWHLAPGSFSWTPSPTR
jgi:glycosyltransferase A (GT-A) superfamily protein (DUF2064 family)